MTKPFQDRAEAGRILAGKLAHFADRPEVLVLGLPRGGVPVAFEVACALGVPLDVFLVRKLGVPGREELAMGAIAGGGVRIVNQDVVTHLHISEAVLDAVTAREERELHRRERDYRGERPELDVRGKVVILIDDGLATGSTMRSAVTALRRRGPRRLVVAVPVAALSICAEFQDEVEEVVCVRTPEPFYAVSLWYEDFPQTTDDEVRDRLARAAARLPSPGETEGREKANRDRGSGRERTSKRSRNASRPASHQGESEARREPLPPSKSERSERCPNGSSDGRT